MVIGQKILEVHITSGMEFHAAQLRCVLPVKMSPYLHDRAVYL